MSKPGLGRFLFVVSSCAAAFGGEFSLQIASPVAAQSFHLKSASFVFRAVGCAEPSKVDVSGTAEGMQNGQRRSVPLKIVNASTPGVFAVNREWPAGGVWVVKLTAQCSKTTAGVLAVAGVTGLDREASKILSRAPTGADVDALLQSLESQKGSSK